MEAYFDETGIHDKAKVCIVAGFYGPKQAWRQFEKRWNSILSKYPQIAEEGFHARRFFARDENKKRVGDYATWSDEKASAFLERLIQCIVTNRIFPIGYAVIVDDFLALPYESRQWFTGARFNRTTGKAETSGCPSKPYYLPFQFCVLKSVELSKASPVNKLDVFVGIDTTFHKYASDLFSFLMGDERLDRSVRSCLGSLRNPLAKQTPGIQAADLLAYRMHRASLDKLRNPHCEPSPILIKLLRNWKGKLQLRLMNSDLFAAMEKAGQEAYERMTKGM
jgi:hypothetical protein